MRLSTLLLTGLFMSSLTAHAQSKNILQTARPKHPYGRAELDLEAALTLSVTPSIVGKGIVVKPSERNTGVGWGFLAKYIIPGYSKVRLGFRLGISSLRVADDAINLSTYAATGVKDKYPIKYANPLVQIGLQAHYDAHLTPKMALRISPFAGWGYAWSNKIEGSSKITAVPVGNTMGFNAGIDASLRIKTNSNLFVLISTGYQRSWMRRMKEDDNSSGYALIPVDSDNGFNLSHFSLGAGVGITF